MQKNVFLVEVIVVLGRGRLDTLFLSSFYQDKLKNSSVKDIL